MSQAKCGANAIVHEFELPKELQQLAPIIRRWAFRSGASREAFLDGLHDHRDTEIEQFFTAVLPFVSQLRSWLKLHLEQSLRPTTTAGNVSYMLSTLQELKPIDWNLVEATIAKMNANAEDCERNEQMEAAALAFKQKDFKLVVQILEKYDSILDTLSAKRLEIARNRLAPWNEA
ncbi:MAG: hypothetical protein U0930_14785 [Pirellulales bacterium]